MEGFEESQGNSISVTILSRYGKPSVLVTSLGGIKMPIEGFGVVFDN
jgi:hypothetical protein